MLRSIWVEIGNSCSCPKVRARLLHARARHDGSVQGFRRLTRRSSIGGSCGTIPDLGIDWPVARDKAVVSDKDRRLPRLRDLAPAFRYSGRAMKVLITGGAGFIGSALCRLLIAETEADVVNLDKLTYAAVAAGGGGAGRTSALSIREGRHLRRGGARPHLFRRISPTRCSISPRNPMSTARSMRHRTSSIPISSAPSRCCRRRAAISTADGGKTRRFPLPPRFDRRGLWLARARRRIPRGHALCAQLALFGQQGGIRPFGARLAPYVRAAGRDDQLLEQLRPVSASGKTDPADDHQRGAWPAAAGLWQRHQHSRLAVRRRPCARPVVRAVARPGRREIQYRRRCRDDQSRSGASDLRHPR